MLSQTELQLQAARAAVSGKAVVDNGMKFGMAVALIAGHFGQKLAQNVNRFLEGKERQYYAKEVNKHEVKSISQN